MKPITAIDETRRWKRELMLAARPEKIADLMRFFKTGPGEYGEGDIFAGIYVPDNRRISRKYHAIPLEQIGLMLDDPIHEFRLAALLALVERYRKARGNTQLREECVDFYLANGAKANNWDLVDLSTEYILGEELAEGRRLDAIDTLLSSPVLWEQRIAVVAMLTPIRHGMLDMPYAVAQRMLTHPHQLMQKAVGWILREAGNKDAGRLLAFIRSNIAAFSSITLSYATEKFPASDRATLRHLRKTSARPKNTK